MLPLQVLLRVDAVLADTKPAVLDHPGNLKGVTDTPDLPLKQATGGSPFFETSKLSFATPLDSPNNLADALRAHVGAPYSGAATLPEKYRFDCDYQAPAPLSRAPGGR